MLQNIRRLSVLMTGVSSGLLLVNMQVPLPVAWSFFAKLGAILGVLGAATSWLSAKLLGEARAGRLVVSLVLLGTTVLLMAGIGEVAVRLAFSHITTTGDNSSAFARTWHAEHVRVNSWDFREREFHGAKPAGTYRIAVIGDSLTFGQGIPEEARFTNRLQEALARRASSYEVLNFGRPGAETVDELVTLERVLADAEPDFVLLQWFVNDVEGHDKEGRPQFLPLLPSATLSSWLQKSSALYYLVSLQWRNVQTIWGEGRHETYVDYMTRRFGSPEGADFRAYRDVLSAFIRQCRDRQVPVGIVVFPMTGGELGHLLDGVLDLCDRESIPCLDLRPAFAPYDGGQALWVNRFDSHPNALANRLAAGEIMNTFGTTWMAGAPDA